MSLQNKVCEKWFGKKNKKEIDECNHLQEYDGAQKRSNTMLFLIHCDLILPFLFLILWELYLYIHCGF